MTYEEYKKMNQAKLAGKKGKEDVHEDSQVKEVTLSKKHSRLLVIIVCIAVLCIVFLCGLYIPGIIVALYMCGILYYFYKKGLW